MLDSALQGYHNTPSTKFPGGYPFICIHLAREVHYGTNASHPKIQFPVPQPGYSIRSPENLLLGHLAFHKHKGIEVSWLKVKIIFTTSAYNFESVFSPAYILTFINSHCYTCNTTPPCKSMGAFRIFKQSSFSIEYMKKKKTNHSVVSL